MTNAHTHIYTEIHYAFKIAVLLYLTQAIKLDSLVGVQEAFITFFLHIIIMIISLRTQTRVVTVSQIYSHPQIRTHTHI